MLVDAKLLLDNDRRLSAANRAYYAMFDAASAVLTNLGIKSKSHKGVISQFGEHVVKKSLVDHRFGRQLSNAYELRQESDYDFYSVITEEEVEKLVKNAEEFIEEMKELIKEG